MEKILYEFRPYFFILTGIAAVCARPDRLMFASAGLLILASLHVVRSRVKYRAWLSS